MRLPRLLGLARNGGGGTPPTERRGLPPEVAAVDEALGRLLAAQVRGIGNHAAGGPSSEACARLLGAGLQGGLEIEGSAPALVTILKHRVEALYGEFRTVEGEFELVTANGVPGIHHADSGELWLGGALDVAHGKGAALKAPPVHGRAPAPAEVSSHGLTSGDVGTPRQPVSRGSEAAATATRSAQLSAWMSDPRRSTGQASKQVRR